MRFSTIVAALLILGAGVAAWYALKADPTPGNQQAARPGQKRGGPPRDVAVPVTVVAVTSQTLPVYREGIGNVQALNTVTVRSQIDGRLMSIEFTEGQTVAKGDVLARIDPTIYQAQYEQALAKKAQDQATLANARIDLQRYQRLALSNAGPKQQADQQVAVVAQLEAQIKADEAAIDNAKATLSYTVIASPLAGRVGLRLVDPGNIVKAGDSGGLVSITQIKPIAVIFTLPQRDLAVISAAMARGGVPVEAMETEGRGVLARGTLQTIDNQIDVSTGTIKLKAVFPNDDLKLWPGQFISTRVVVDTLVDAKVVPTAAVRRGPTGTFVYLIGPDTKAVVKPVKVGLQDEMKSVITDGIDVGTQVVTAGFNLLANGKLVQINPGGPGDTPAVVPGDAAKRDGKDAKGGKERRKREQAGSSDKPG